MTSGDVESESTLQPVEAAGVAGAWGIGRALALVVFVLAETVLGSYFLARGGASVLLLAVVLFVVYALYVVAVWMGTRRSGLGFARSVGFARVDRPGMWLAAALGGAVLARVVTAVYAIVLAVLNLTPPGQSVDLTKLFPAGVAGTIMAAIAIGVLAPFAEELVFRGVLLRSLRKRWGIPVAIVGSSVVFALAHFSGYDFVPIALTAVILGWLYVRSGSLWVSMVAHSAYNLLALALLLALKAAGA
ncbi:MAG: CPBP family intramembrane metalloprotease [Coriobacteriia bacterium]|nr:CPBP family intramembrane metalloprotease [Coriobacteriia bacterium]